MRIRWFGHSCFSVEHQGFTVVLDPYKPGMIPGLGSLDLQADRVLCSHEHGDHNHRAAVRIVPVSPPNPFTIERLSSFHDREGGSRRGMNQITVLAAGGFRVAHLGDLGCLPDEGQKKALSDLDCLMVPVGGYYTIDAVEAHALCDRLRPRIILPMHYRGDGFGPAVIAPVADFLRLFPASVVRMVDADAIDVATAPTGVVVLAFETGKH